MRTLSLREHATASVGDAPREDQLTVSEAKALQRAQCALGVEAFRWHSPNKVKAAQYVGMLATPTIRLEVLPKIEGLEGPDTRRIVVRMIAAAWSIPVRDGEITGHAYQKRDLLELLISLFACRLNEQVRAGISRAYDQRQDDLSRLRGKLNVIRQFTRWAASPQKLACSYDEFTPDTSLNRLLLCAITFLRRRSVHADTQRLLSEIAAHFENVQEVAPAEALAQQVMLNRANQRWKISETLARLLLSEIYQTTHGGDKEGVALLFDMNLLFEAYIASLARKTCVPLGYKVRAQSPQRYLARDEANRGLFSTKPDLHIERNGDVLILDTKWKRVDPNRPNLDVAQADAYQMYGYAQVYRSRAVILVYPHHRQIVMPGLQLSWHFTAGDRALKVATIDLTDPGGFAVMLTRLLSPAPVDANRALYS